MVDDALMIGAVEDLANAFNRGDLAAWASHFDEHVNVVLNDSQVVTGREEFLGIAAQLREQGFIAETISSAVSRDDLFTCHFVNGYADGTRLEGGVIFRFGDDGKVLEQRGLVAGPPASGSILTEQRHLDDALLVGRWLAMLDAFERGEDATFGSLFAEDFNAMVNDVRVPSRDAFVEAVWAGRARGWTAQRPQSMVARAGVLTTHYTNSYADGTATHGCGIASFDGSGRITRTRALTDELRSMQPG